MRVTDEELRELVRVFVEASGYHHPHHAVGIRAVLDRAAPVIEARAREEALREAANVLAERAKLHHGHWQRTGDGPAATSYHEASLCTSVVENLSTPPQQPASREEPLQLHDGDRYCQPGHDEGHCPAGIPVPHAPDTLVRRPEPDGAKLTDEERNELRHGFVDVEDARDRGIIVTRVERILAQREAARRAVQPTPEDARAIAEMQANFDDPLDIWRYVEERILARRGK